MKNKIDLTKCENCGKHPNGKLAERNFKNYYPFCSFHCQTVYGLHGTKTTYL